MNSIFIFGAKYLFILSVLIAAIYWLYQPRWLKKEIAIYGIVSLVFIYLTALICSHFYYDPRPFVVGHFTPLVSHAPDNGFPSDHALITSALAAIIYAYNKRIGILLFILAICVSISRVYVGVHHVADVVGSFIISIVVASVVYLIINRRKKSLLQK